MRTETIEVVSVKGGKFHRLENTAVDQDQPAWTPRAMVCGRTLEPHNFFQTAADADSYTGGRLETYACKHCFADAII